LEVSTKLGAIHLGKIGFEEHYTETIILLEEALSLADELTTQTT
jgi:hypothetical protein